MQSLNSLKEALSSSDKELKGLETNENSIRSEYSKCEAIKADLQQKAKSWKAKHTSALLRTSDL